MKELLPDEYDDFIASYDEAPVSAIRINTDRISAERFESIAPFSIQKVPFFEGGYYINDTDAWSKHPYYYAGLYYIQEASAMIPADVLPVGKDDAVLDLCAAPGGKSTQLASKHPKLLMSNDISFSRAMPLVKNMAMWGCTDHLISCADPEDISGNLSGCFDKILVDAPCSGEGMFRRDGDLIRSYNERGNEYYRNIQDGILDAAYTMLSPGGMLVYSTCTFSDIEDELVIASFLDRHGDMSVCDIEKKNGLTGPYDSYSHDERLNGCVHALPHRIKGEGHFVTLMQKQGAGEREYICRCDEAVSFKDLPKEVHSFLAGSDISKTEEYEHRDYIVAKDGFIYMLPYGYERIYRKGIRYLRTGVCVGKIGRGGRFSPHTAFALTLSCDSYANTLNMPADAPDVIKYLKGETIVAGKSAKDDVRKGIVLVCVDSFPLGFASYDGIRFKNLYEKGWVYR